MKIKIILRQVITAGHAGNFVDIYIQDDNIPITLVVDVYKKHWTLIRQTQGLNESVQIPINECQDKRIFFGKAVKMIFDKTYPEYDLTQLMLFETGEGEYQFVDGNAAI